MSMDLRHLRAFLAVSEEMNFTKAAERLHITQPTLSVIIRDLEQGLETKLFDRTTRTVCLTYAGQNLVTHARRLLRDFERTVTDMRSIADLKQGNIKVAALPSVACSLLPAALSELQQKHPSIDVTLLDCAADGVIAALEEGEAELGITVLKPEYSDNYEVTHLTEDALVAVLPLDHPKSHKDELTWRDLKGDRCILMRTGTSVRELIDESGVLEKHDLSLSIQASYMSSAIALTRAGLGLTILPSLGVQSVRADEVCCRPLTKPTLKRSIGIIQRKDRWLPPAAEAFKQLLIAQAASSPKLIYSRPNS